MKQSQYVSCPFISLLVALQSPQDGPRLLSEPLFDVEHRGRSRALLAGPRSVRLSFRQISMNFLAAHIATGHVSAGSPTCCLQLTKFATPF